MKNSIKTVLLSKFKSIEDNSKLINKSIEWINSNNVGITKKHLEKNKNKNITDYLFYMGNEKLLENPIIAIIGSRVPNDYGYNAVERIIRSIKGDYATVSGFARGIDSAVHKVSVKYNIPTIGILGCGFAINYPSSNSKLKKDIIDKGLLLTEYAPFTKPYSSNFISRNEIIAHIADALIIIQGKKRSGTLNTLNAAMNLNKEIYGLPGNIDNELSFAPNYAIKCGALPICDINSLFFTKKINAAKLTEDERSILEIIRNDNSIDNLMKKTIFTKSRLFSIIISLEIKGIIKRTKNNTYAVMEDSDE
ncbi:DNA-protecting protein DprA [candidate division WOR-3 bacterium]|nr:DNA-protecting protein DprA [candidate division WOR-3 bacterium]